MLSDTGSGTAGGMAAALMLATSRLLASTGRPSSAVERSLASNALFARSATLDVLSQRGAVA
jgi:hypothetical protein